MKQQTQLSLSHKLTYAYKLIAPVNCELSIFMQQFSSSAGIGNIYINVDMIFQSLRFQS